MENKLHKSLLIILIILLSISNTVYASSVPKGDIGIRSWKKVSSPPVNKTKFNMSNEEYKGLEVIKAKDMYFIYHEDEAGLNTVYASKDMKNWSPILAKESNIYLSMMGLETGFSFVFYNGGYYVILSLDSNFFDGIYRSKNGFDWELAPMPDEITSSDSLEYLDFYKNKPALILATQGSPNLVANIYRFKLEEDKIVYEKTDPNHKGEASSLEVLRYNDLKIPPREWVIKEKPTTKIGEKQPTKKLTENKTSPELTRKDKISIIINGELINLDKAPTIKNGRTLVPLRGIFEALGADVSWDSNNRIIKAVRNNIVIKMEIDNNLLSITESGDAKFQKMDVVPEIINSSTFVPVRAISQSFGAEVDWNPKNKTISITTKDKAYPRDYGGYKTLESYLDSRNFETILSGVAQVEFPYHNDYKEPLLPKEVLGKDFIKNIKLGKVKVSYPNIGKNNRGSKKSTGIPIFDETIDYIEKEIIRKDMTDGEVIKAVYDFVIYNFKHDNNFSFESRYNDLRKYYHGKYLKDYPGGDGFVLLYNKSGVCDHYASLLSSILSRLGFESEIDGGYYVNRDGSTYPHAWTRVKLNNTWYYFDPDIESRQVQKGSKPSYNWFMKTKNQWKSNHQW